MRVSPGSARVPWDPRVTPPSAVPYMRFPCLEGTAEGKSDLQAVTKRAVVGGLPQLLHAVPQSRTPGVSEAATACPGRLLNARAYVLRSVRSRALARGRGPGASRYFLTGFLGFAGFTVTALVTVCDSPWALVATMVRVAFSE
jgi:hypothetical protein